MSRYLAGYCITFVQVFNIATVVVRFPLLLAADSTVAWRPQRQAVRLAGEHLCVFVVWLKVGPAVVCRVTRHTGPAVVVTSYVVCRAAV